MKTYTALKDRLKSLNEALMDTMARAQSLPGVSPDAFERWQITCRTVLRQLDDDAVRVAVVGPIKSGKSTVVNSIFRGDYLKRGAGVVTSMVTKVRSGERLRARLVFKSWKGINSDIERAVVMLPTIRIPSNGDGLDIRDKATRRALAAALDNLPREYLIARDSRNMNSVLLANYLAGYDEVAATIGDDTRIRVFEQEQFARHRDFAADDRLSVYLEDIQLDIDSVEMDPTIEIADCQGSDSPNPLHLARIQDYLLLTNLTVYVISSRTGLRQADINFLSMIDRMGISDHLVFVINCDLDEHETLKSLTDLVQRIRNEISLIKFDPEVHVFSGLLNLFRSQSPDQLTEKDARRLSIWQMEDSLVRFSDEGTESFEASLYHKLNRQRYALLLKNHVQRLSLVASGLSQWAAANRRLLEEDEQSAASIFESTRRHKEKLDRAGGLLKSTLDGSARKLKKDLRSDIDRFFDPKAGEVMPELISFIRNYQVDLGKYEQTLATAGFSNVLYMAFQEFKQTLDVFMAKSINPKVLGFVRKQEQKIADYFESIAESFDSMARDAIAEYKKAMKDLGIPTQAGDQGTIKNRDITLVKAQSGLQLPPAVFAMNYTGKIRTEAVMRLGVYSAGKFFKKLLKKPVKTEKEGELRALKDGMGRILRETEKGIVFHFKSYRENIKFQYVLKLAEAVSDSFYNAVMDRFRAYGADISSIRDAVAEKRVDKEQMADALAALAETVSHTGQKIVELSGDLAFAADTQGKPFRQEDVV
ncbi:MAG: dynamin family protein [Thermodesulfobacteriota bacterium]|nr:dynamin family protein [Thermodesulfobacteriota bacterium]